MDVCSPGELLHALANGFAPEEISYTGTNLSERDLDAIVPTGVHVNLDLLTQIERYGRRCPGRTVGLRLNPRAGVMRGHAESLYSGGRPTKFGIYEEDLDEAWPSRVATASSSTRCTSTSPTGSSTTNCRRTTPPSRRWRAWRSGCWRPAARSWRSTPAAGSGRRCSPASRPLDLDALAGILARRFGHLGVAVGVEPGEFLTNLSGVLLAEVVSVEDRLGATFVGLDVGWNVFNDPYVYGRPAEAVVVARARAPRDQVVTLAGHINEGNDIFGADLPFPNVREGEIVALASAGGYCAGMWTDHCMRPRAGSLYFSDRI